MQRRIFSLLLLIAGVLLFQSAQAQTLFTAPDPLTGATTVVVPPGLHQASGQNLGNPFIVNALSGGTITGKGATLGDLTFEVQGFGTQLLHASGQNSHISMTNTVLDMTNHIPSNDVNRVAFAVGGGTVILTDCTINAEGSASGTGSPPNTNNRGVDSDVKGSTLTATGTTINMGGDRQVGATAFGGGVTTLTNCRVTLTGSIGIGIASQQSGGAVTTLNATNTMISGSGDRIDFVNAYFKGATTTIDNCIVEGSGTNHYGLDAYFGGAVNVTNSTVTFSGSNPLSGNNGALVDSGSILNVVGNSTISGDVNGILIADENHTLGRDTVALTNSKLTNLAGGNGEAAFRVVGADVDIFVTDSTVDSGVGATQHTLLNVTEAEPFVIPNANVTGTPVVTQATNHPSSVNMTADSSILNGDILVDATSRAKVVLTSNSVLTGAINENSLTGATGI